MGRAPHLSGPQDSIRHRPDEFIAGRISWQVGKRVPTGKYRFSGPSACHPAVAATWDYLIYTREVSSGVWILCTLLSYHSPPQLLSILWEARWWHQAFSICPNGKGREPHYACVGGPLKLLLSWLPLLHDKFCLHSWAVPSSHKCFTCPHVQTLAHRVSIL